MDKKDVADALVGLQMADGSVFAGLTADKTHKIYTLPADLEPSLPFNQAVKAVKKLNKQKFLGHNDWQIPAVDSLQVLYENQNRGALKETFKKGAGTSGDFNFYLSSTVNCSSFFSTSIENINFVDGSEWVTWSKTPGLSCRPVRLVSV